MIFLLSDLYEFKEPEIDQDVIIEEFNLLQLRNSYFNDSMEPIFIDGNSFDKNWTWAESQP